MVMEIHQVVVSPEKSQDPPFSIGSLTDEFYFVFRTLKNSSSSNIGSPYP